jgi:serine/threonine protein phosphatase PrpC
MQGWRASESGPQPLLLFGLRGTPRLTYFGCQIGMEDAHTALLKFDEDRGNALFAVFDGHMGAPFIILQTPGCQPYFTSRQGLPLQHSLRRMLQDASSSSRHIGNLCTSRHLRRRSWVLIQTSAPVRGNDIHPLPFLIHAILRPQIIPRSFGLHGFGRSIDSRSAICGGWSPYSYVWVGSEMMFQANAGDSRAVLSCKGLAKPMSYDHKPTHPREHSGTLSALVSLRHSAVEKERILAAGGSVECDRVDGEFIMKAVDRPSRPFIYQAC